MPKNHTQTPAQYVAQLQELLAYQASPPHFRVGQLIRRKLLSLPVTHRDENLLVVAAVIEVIPDMRAHTGDRSDTKGPAMRIAYLDDAGAYHEAYAEAWMYEALTHEQIAAITGQTTH